MNGTGATPRKRRTKASRPAEQCEPLDSKSPGQIAYEAYMEFLIPEGERPLWNNQAPQLREAWDAAGRAVRQIAQGA